MDGYQLIAALFQSLVSLAWPAALVLVAMLFRGKIRELLPFLRLKYKDFDMSFRLNEAEKEAQALPAPEQPSEPTPEETDKFERLSEVSPRAAIKERRHELEDALQNLARATGIKAINKGIVQLTRELRKAEIIDQGTSALLDDLRAIGNAAAHDVSTQITQNDAARFRSLTDRLIQQLQITAGAARMNQAPQPLP
jgi:hypothetical protein